MTGAIDVKSGPGFFVFFGQKNDHSSTSVNSFDSRPIFTRRSGQQLSRNTFVDRILFLGRNSYRSKGFRTTLEIDKNDEISTFPKIDQIFGKLLCGEV